MQICLVARQLLDEAVERQQLEKNPASAVRGFSGEDETTHLALTDEQAQALLDSIPTNTLSGQRDYTMILLLLRTGNPPFGGGRAAGLRPYHAPGTSRRHHSTREG